VCHEVILRGLSGELTWLQAADILGCSPRSLRRYERWGYDGLPDRRRGRPSPRRVPLAEVQRILRLYRERYPEFSTRHSGTLPPASMPCACRTGGSKRPCRPPA
jgi:hypothetical protein